MKIGYEKAKHRKW